MRSAPRLADRYAWTIDALEDIMEILDLSHNDDLLAVIRKCNANFKQLAFSASQGIKAQGRASSSGAEAMIADAINEITNVTIPDEISNLEYASSPSSGGNADMTNAILYGHVDSSSTATAFTATVPGLTELVDGTCIMLKNGVVTSASGFTIDVNGLGPKPSYSNLAAATRDTTLFNINYTMLFVYDSTRVSGGAWICYRGYDSNTNTIGYQLRTNSSTLHASDKTYRYRLLFTSANRSELVPANTSTSTNATAARTANTRPIDPFGPILYYGSTSVVDAGSSFGTGSLWQQYTLTLGYSFNSTGSVLSMSYPAPVYLRCEPQPDGSAIMEDFTQSLPTTEDGKIYIFLGRAYSATAIELLMTHPVYEFKGGMIRQYSPNAYPPIGSYLMAQSDPSGTYPGTTWQQSDTIGTTGGMLLPLWERTA